MTAPTTEGDGTAFPPSIFEYLVIDSFGVRSATGGPAPDGARGDTDWDDEDRYPDRLDRPVYHGPQDPYSDEEWEHLGLESRDRGWE